MKVAIVALALAAGCSGSSVPRPGQARALEIVWVHMYGMELGSAPAVEWVAGKDVFAHADGFTYAGWKVVVADKDGAPISLTAFAHELMHYRTFLLTGDIDAAHWRGDWKIVDGWEPGQTCYELDREGL